MIPLFTTDYSIGKSILKFKPSKTDDGPDSVVEIAKENSLKKVFILENRMHGFLDYLRYSQQNDFDFNFGLILNIKSNEEDQTGTYKINIFAKNDQGIKLLYKIYSLAFTENNGSLFLSDVKRFWDSDSLLLAIPFYDSYVYYNNFTYDQFVPEFSGLGDIYFFIEKNGLPIDHVLHAKVQVECKLHNGELQEVKSIFYKNKKDFAAYQVRKIIHNRKGARTNTLNKPNLDGCSSDQFCFESWLEHERQTV